MKTILTPNGKVVIIIFSFLVSLFLISENSHPFLSCKSASNIVQKDSIVPWQVPEISSLTDNAESTEIRLGKSIFTDTYRYIGPDVKDKQKRFAGTNMDCQNCHLKAGTQKNVFGLIGTYTKYPEMDTRSGKIINLQERINNCLMRSMNGRAMPEDSPEMKALTAYIKWLSTYVPKGTRTLEQGIPKIQLLSRAADTSSGRIVYLGKCMTCHSEDGEGALNIPGNVDVPADSVKGYDFPPVFGNNSYNEGAGMYKLLTAASFIYSKMPFHYSELTVEESYDVAAFINSKPRPLFKDVGKDYPDLKNKPIDSPFPPYADSFTQSQHKYGPYGPMLKEGEKSIMIKPE
jgi:thiosulfate dehydrogenase